METLRVRHEPGPWAGAKGARIATAALSAAAIQAGSGGRGGYYGYGYAPQRKKRSIGSAVGGLLINRALNGPKRSLRR